MRLSDVIQVAPRYTRSVNIERDQHSESALDGYVVTSSAHGVLGRVIEGLRDPFGQRAWSITGPYGTGKSALGLFLARLLDNPDKPTTADARELVSKFWPDSGRQFFRKSAGNPLGKGGYIVVPVSGSREPFIDALIRAAARNIRSSRPGIRRLKTVQRLNELNDRSLNGGALNSTEVVEAVSGAARQIVAEAHALGVVLVIDELGKFLEFAAQKPDSGDVFLLQQLGEATVPQAGNHLVLLTILHQAFDRYADGLPPAARAEWRKVQGRFEDIAFSEPPDSVLSLLGSAIQHKNSSATAALRQANQRRAEQLYKLGLCPSTLSRRAFADILGRCAPLHPLAALALTRLARKFGQNQRSIFSFLTSQEPAGFSEYLTREQDHASAYGLAELFDYTSGALGEALSQGEAASRWSAAQTVIDRAVDCSATEVRVLKSVGLLSAIGSQGKLAPTPEILKIAFDVDERRFDALSSLVNKSLLVERRYNGTVGLWDGSDLDLDERLREASLRLPESSDAAELISTFWQPRPAVAKQHSFRTGTLRYFDAAVADGLTFAKRAVLGPEADGRIVYLFPSDLEDAAALEANALTESSKEELLVFVIAGNFHSIRSALREDQLLNWVEANTPELQADAVARRELKNRRSWVRANLERLIESSVTPGSTAKWISLGEVQPFGHQRHVSAHLSFLCDRVFDQTPILHNELVNRRNLSSAAAAARRNVMAAMLQSPHRTQLGFAGNPPEVAIYRSILSTTGLHREQNGEWRFERPQEGDNLYSVWLRAEEFLESSAGEKRSVAELFSLLQERPFGMKAGVLPLILTALVAVYGSELALYEDGIFTPELTIEGLERLVRSPHKFHLRQYRMQGIHRELFKQLAAVVKARTEAGTVDLIEVVRPLYAAFNALPVYTRNTRRISTLALAIRSALADAREPDALLFGELPKACGAAIDYNEPQPEVIAAFVNRLRAGLQELDQAYANLLDELKDSLFRVFDVQPADGRDSLRDRATLVLQSAPDLRLRAFCMNLSEDMADDAHWIEAIATMVVGKAPRVWSDHDKAKFDVSIPDLVRSFRHVAAVASEQLAMRRSGLDGRVLRLGIAEPGIGSYDELVHVYSGDEQSVTELVLEIEELLGKRSEQRSATIAALGMVLRNRLATKNSGEPAVLSQETRSKSV